jgi:RNA polymerase sigma-B factor
MTPKNPGAPASAPSWRDLAPAPLEPLFRRWQRDGDGAAREALVSQHLPLARELARRYSPSSECYEDLVQVAGLELMKAIDRYDPARGESFAGFAIPRILGELRRCLRDGALSVHVGRGAKERALAVGQATDRLTDLHGRAPTAQQLAEYLELSLEDVLDGLLVANDTQPLDAPATSAEDDDGTFGGAVGAAEEGHTLVDDRAVGTHLPSLSERERHILHMRFSEEMTQSEIAARVGVSQMQIARVLRRSLERMRELPM